MTPQTNIGNAHLTSEQISGLLVPARPGAEEEADGQASAEAHVQVCRVCAAELSSLREALTAFQKASIVHADGVYSRLPTPISSVPMSRQIFPPGLLWIAASTMLMAGIVPIEIRWQHGAKAGPAISASSAVHAETDEALLEDVDREVSLSVPAPMQALADPARDGAGNIQISKLTLQTTQTSAQRKN